MIYPYQFPSNRSTEYAEKKVFERFESLKDKYDIFYSKSFISDTVKKEFEIDFILAEKADRQNKCTVIICVEVKGGIVEYDGTNNIWQATNLTNASDATNDTYGKYPSTFINGHKINVEFLEDVFKQAGLLKGFSRFALSYIFTDVELDSDNTYRYLSNYFRHQAILNMEFKLPFIKLPQSIIVRYEEPIRDLAESDDYGWVKIDTQTSFPAKLIWWKFDGTLSIRNLLGTAYYDEKIYVTDANQPIELPGRSVQFGFKYNFK